MIEYLKPDSVPQADGKTSASATKIVGLGGAGSNVLDQIVMDGPPAARLVCVDSDIRTLKASAAHTKVQLGTELTRGLGAGGDPELGLQAAEETEDEVRRAVAGANMVFLCAGLGGGTASGAASVLARFAKEAGAFVIVFASMPFTFEGRRRLQQAEMALRELERIADAVITFDNDRMGELVLAKEGIQETFSSADRIIGQSIQAVINVVSRPGLIKLGMDDLLTALKNPDSRCLFGHGRASGKNRVQVALKRALASPLLDKGALLGNTANTLVHVVGGPSMTLFEIQDLMERLTKHVHPDTQILFGTGVDESLGNDISVTVMSSLSASELARPETDASEKAGDPAIGSEGSSPAEDRRDSETGAEEAEHEASDVAAEEAGGDPEVEEKAPEGELSEEAESSGEEADDREEPGDDVPSDSGDSEDEIDPATMDLEWDEERAEAAEAAAAEVRRRNEEEEARRREETRRREDARRREEEAEARRREETEQARKREREAAERRRAEEEAESHKTSSQVVLVGDDIEEIAPRRRPEGEAEERAPQEHQSDRQEDGKADASGEEWYRRKPQLPSERRKDDEKRRKPRDRDYDPRSDSRQQELEFDAARRGRFEKADPTIVDGQNLDVPTIFRRRVPREASRRE